MSPLKPITVKIDDDLEEALITMAAQRQESSGERVTVSDIIRETLTSRVYAERISQGVPDDFCCENPDDFENLNNDPYMVQVAEPYEPIGRTILQPIYDVDDTQPIERDISTKAYVIPRRGGVPDMIVENEELVIPFFEIATNPKWHMREGIGKETSVIAQAKDSLSRQEDHEILSLISNAVLGDPHPSTKHSHAIWVTGEFEPGQITKLCLLLWEHEVKVANIVYNPRWQDVVNDWVDSQRGRKWPLGQCVEAVNLFPCTMCPQDQLFVLAPAEMVGRVTINIDANVVNDNEPGRLRYGRVVWESIGVCVINDYCTTKLVLI